MHPSPLSLRRSRKLSGLSHRRGAQGRRTRVAFPLYQQLWAQTQWQVWGRGAAASSTRAPALRLAVALEAALDFEDEGIWWRLRHQLGDLTLWGAGLEGGLMPWRLSAVEGIFLRHDLGAFVVLPSLGDLRVPAPFDLAMEYRLLRLDGQAGEGGGVRRMAIGELALLIDVLRDDAYRHRLAFGAAAWHDATRVDGAWQHTIAPLSGARLVYSFDQRDGLAQVRAALTCGAATPLGGASGGGWRSQCVGELTALWTPLAILDGPVSIPLSVRAEAAPLSLPQQAQVEVSVGLRWAAPLD